MAGAFQSHYQPSRLGGVAGPSRPGKDGLRKAPPTACLLHDVLRSDARASRFPRTEELHRHAQNAVLALLAQNRVRPSPAPPAATAAGKKEANASPKPKLRAPEPPLPQ